MPYYTPTGAPASNAQGRSQPIRDEFQLIADAFDTAETAIDAIAADATYLKLADGDGSISTVQASRDYKILAFDAAGDPITFPPAASSRVNKVLAWDASGNMTLGAAATGTILPSQTGNSGKYLTTDGSNPSWSAITAFESISDFTYGGGSVTLSAASTQMVRMLFDGTNDVDGSEGIRLPDATTMRVGDLVAIFGSQELWKSTVSASFRWVEDNSGQLLFGRAGAAPVYAILTNNATAAGAWDIHSLDYSPSTIDPVYSCDSPWGTLDSGNSFTCGSVAKISSTSGLFVYGKSSGALGVYAQVCSFDGATWTINSAANTGTDIVATNSFGLFKLTTGYAFVYSTSTYTSTAKNIKIVPIKVSGTTVTFGTTQTITTTADHGYLADANGDKVVVSWKDLTADKTRMVVCSYDNTTPSITVGSIQDLHNPTTMNTYGGTCTARWTGADKGVAASYVYDSTGLTYHKEVWGFTVSGTEITLGTPVSFTTTADETDYIGVDIAVIDDTAFWLAVKGGSGGNGWIGKWSKSGTVVTEGNVLTVSGYGNATNTYFVNAMLLSEGPVLFGFNGGTTNAAYDNAGTTTLIDLANVTSTPNMEDLIQTSSGHYVSVDNAADIGWDVTSSTIVDAWPIATDAHRTQFPPSNTGSLMVNFKDKSVILLDGVSADMYCGLHGQSTNFYARPARLGKELL